MMPFTSQMRRLRHVYSMLQNIDKENITPNATLHNILKDIQTLVDKLWGETAP